MRKVKKLTKLDRKKKESMSRSVKKQIKAQMEEGIVLASKKQERQRKLKRKKEGTKRPTPFPYQREGAQKIQQQNGVVLLADEMGLGKSGQALMWCRRNKEEALPIVVVCPAFLTQNWANEFKIWTDIEPFIISSNNILKMASQMVGKPEAIIINYEKVAEWLAFFDFYEPNTVIFDETQYIKNLDAQRTRAAIQLALGTEEKPKKIKHRMGLSGTATENGRPYELYPILKILWPNKFSSFPQYAHRYCDPKPTVGGWLFNGATNIEELNDRLNSLGMVRRLKKDVLKQLPKKTITVLPVEIERKEYDEAELNFLDWLRKKFGFKKALKAAKAMLIVRLGYLIRLAAWKKMKIVKEWIQDFDDNTADDRKLIVFGKHKSVLNSLHTEFENNSVLITGDVAIKKRPEICQNFQMNKKIRHLFGNYAAMGVGLNLTAASDGLLIETDWTPGKHSQAIARMDRIGQKNKVHITWMVAKNTVEEKLCALVRKKEELNTAILDGKNAHVEFDVLDSLVEELLN